MQNKKEQASQSKRFITTARELGCDETEHAFDRALKKVASAPPPESVAKRKERKPDAK